MTMIERVAEVMKQATIANTDQSWVYSTSEKLVIARAAIAAMREPTNAMLKGGENWQKIGWQSIWRAMIDAALEEQNVKG